MSWKAFLSRNLQGLKFMACPKTPSSAGVRDFWINNYAEIKHLNPRFPFMIRGVGEIDPYVLVEYDFGRKEKIVLTNLSAEQVEERIRQAVVDGEHKPRAYFQSVAPLQLPTIVD